MNDLPICAVGVLLGMLGAIGLLCFGLNLRYSAPAPRRQEPPAPPAAQWDGWKPPAVTKDDVIEMVKGPDGVWGARC